MFARPLAATTNSATATAIPSERDVDAHLSEGIPRYWLLDNTSLRSEPSVSVSVPPEPW